MGNPVIIEMMVREKIRDLHAERRRLEPDPAWEILPGKGRIGLLREVLSSAWKKAVRLVPAWDR